ncbi:MAG: Ppx/GppA family phosphatase, partial [Actinobacteria bacterium]|nr:Ppx/GppA family phosphatase [Actinomycetota bacterium]
MARPPAAAAPQAPQVIQPASGPPDRSYLAALDIGTNSFHLVVARVIGDDPTAYEVVTRQKETIRLGHGGGDMKVLSPDAIDRGINALRRMSSIAASFGAPVRAVATSAVREAENADVFIGRA